MSLWGRLRKAWRSITLADFAQLGLLDPPTVAGISVTTSTALTYAAFWNAVYVISSQVAVLPRILYKRGTGDERERATNNPLYRLVHGAPNPLETNFQFWQTVMTHALTWGNGYAEIEFDRALRPIALWPITPDLLEPVAEREVSASGKISYRIWYRYRGSRRLEAEDILHIPGMGFDGITGYSVVAMARQSIGLGLAAEQFGGAFFGNGAYPGVVLEHPGKISSEAYTRLKESWRRDHQGAKALGPQIAEEGMKVNKVGIPPDDAQFLETREHQVVEIARWFNLPPHKLKHKVGERPGGNIEASQTEFLTDTLMPWLITIEQECNRKLISASQQATLYVEHLTAALLRPDAKTRSEVQRSYFDMGVLDADTIAQQENLPKPDPRPAGMAERIEQVGQLVRAGFDPVESLSALGLPPIKHLGMPPVTVQPPVEPEPAAPPPGEEPPPEDQPPPGQEDQPDEQPPPDEAARMAKARRTLLLDVAARYVRREAFHVRRASRLGPGGFEAWQTAFYAREEGHLRGVIGPAVGLVLAWKGCPADAGAVAGDLARAYLAQSREALGSLPARQLAEQAEWLVTRWETARPMELADAIAAAGVTVQADRVA